MKKEVIQFIAQTKEMLEVLERPFPAITSPPEWLSNMPSYMNGERSVDGGDTNATIKKCMPLLDGVTAGYYIPTHTDIWVENNGIDNISIKWAWNTIEVVTFDNQAQLMTFPVPDGYQPSAFKFLNPWIIKTPPGWSTLLTHPINYDPLPFQCITGIVDTDKFPIPINFLFFLKKGFSGLIPKGTPIMQAIPIKRANFISEFSHDDGFFKQQWTKAHSVFFDRYKKFFRSPKKYDQGTEKKCPFAFLGNGVK